MSWMQPFSTLHRRKTPWEERFRVSLRVLQKPLISKVVFYNCRGWKSGSNYVQSLLQSCYICLIQEHWLLRENLDSLIISDDFLSIGVSGIDSSILLTGRPFGGCGILYRKSLSSVVRRIFADSNCLCAISITLNNSCDNSPFVILLICVYLPTDYSTAASHSGFLWESLWITWPYPCRTFWQYYHCWWF